MNKEWLKNPIYNKMKNLKRFINLFFFLGITSYAFSQNVTLYVVDVNDTDLSNVKRYVYTQQTLNTKFSTIVDVRKGNNSIGKICNWDNKELTKTDFKKIVETILITCDNGLENNFDGTLGFRWDMNIEEVIERLDDIGIRSWKFRNGHIESHKNQVVAENVTFENLTLRFSTFTDNNKYLTEIRMNRICKDMKDAKSLMEVAAGSLRRKYGLKAVESSLDKEGFEQYEIYNSNKSRILPQIRLNLFVLGKDIPPMLILTYNSPALIDFFDPNYDGKGIKSTPL